MRASAKTGRGVHRLPRCCSTSTSGGRRGSSAKVNEVIQQAQRAATPRVAGTLPYATRVATGPPSFVIWWCNEPDGTYQRYLENRLRRPSTSTGADRLKFGPASGTASAEAAVHATGTITPSGVAQLG